MKYADTNVILRYLLADHEELSPLAKEILENHEDIFIGEGVLAELVYVLNKTYKVDRQAVSHVLIEFLHLPNIQTFSLSIAEKSLQIFAQGTLDYIDTLLLAHHEISGTEIITFDKKLKQLLKKDQ